MWKLKHLYETRRRLLYRCPRMRDGFLYQGRTYRTTATLLSMQYNKRLEISEGVLESCNVQNGMRLVAQHKESYTATIGCFFPGGSIYEEPGERGSALFLQNLLFRRTTQRDEQTLQREFAEIGANLVTVAERDIFIFYATVETRKAESLIELFADVILNGVVCKSTCHEFHEISCSYFAKYLGDEDIVSQRFIILRNLKKMESDHEKVVMDYLPSTAYQDTELAKSVYPESRVIKQFCAEKLMSFRDRVLKPCCVTMISVGAICLEDLQKYVVKSFITNGDCRELQTSIKGKTWPDPAQFRFSGADLRLRDDDQKLGYVAAGIEGAGYVQYEDLCALNVAKEIVGSWDMSYPGLNHNAPYLAHCAFNTNLCRAYKSFYNVWAQTGIWGCYFVADKMKLDPMMRMIQEEWRRLCTVILEKEVERAVNRCKTIELMKLDEPIQHFLDIVTHLSRKGCYESLQERIRKYEMISADTIRQVSDKYIYDQCPAVIAVGRIENLLDYNIIRSRMYSLLY